LWSIRVRLSRRGETVADRDWVNMGNWENSEAFQDRNVRDIQRLIDGCARESSTRSHAQWWLRPQSFLSLGVAVWLWSLLGGWSFGEVEKSSLEIVGLRVGVGGVYKAGLWTPLWVQVRGGATAASGKLWITVPDDEGGPCSFCSPSVVVGADETREVEMLIQIGRPRAQVVVRWESSDGFVTEKTYQAGSTAFAAAVTARTPVFVWLSSTEPPLGLTTRRNEKGHWIWVKNPEQLPTHFLAYQSVRCVVLAAGNDQTFNRAIERSREQMLALRDWVRNGGKLVASLGPQCSTLLNNDGPLAWTTPGVWQGTITLRRFSGIESYVDSPRPIILRRGDAPFQAHQCGNIDGVVTAREGNIPLVVRRQFGLGTVIFFTPDLSHRALLEWNQWDRLIDRLVGYSVVRDESVHNQPRTLMHYGYVDLVGQLRSALDVLPTISFFPFSWVAVAVFVYLVVIGPLDYWLLGFGLRNYRWTWLTFPAMILLATGASWILGGTKGTEPVAREVQWVDYDLADGTARGLAFASLYTPRPDSYEVRFSLPQLKATPDAHQKWLGWFGIPGHGLGGMENVTGFLNSLEPYLATPEEGVLKEVVVNQWSTRSFWAIWTARNKTPPLVTDVFDREGILRGRIQNNLDVTLDNCVVAYGDWAYSLGTLEPGKSWESVLGDDRRELRSWLNGRQVFVEGEGVRAQTRQRVEPYDPGSRDVGYILQMMAFYEAAGGIGYVDLSHEYWPFFDGSEWLTNGRAVMIGRVRPDSRQVSSFDFRAKTTDKDHTQLSSQEVFCRFVIPVARKTSTND